MKELTEINYLCISERVFISRVISNKFFLNKGMLRFSAFELHFKFLKEKLLIF